MAKKMSGIRKPAWRCSSFAFYLFFSYAVLIWCCELADLFCWLAGAPQTTVLSRIAAFLLAAFIMIRLVGVPETEGERPDLFFVVGALFITAFFAVKSIRPDLSYDTQNYHMLSQISGFVDNLHYHVMPGRFQMFGFRLGDRMFYPFRAIFGLRMGTMLNAAAMVVLYRQVTVFLEWFRKGLPGAGKTSRFIGWPSVLAFLIVSRFELIQESGTYMVELLALPVFLEMVFLLVREKEEERLSREALVFCFLGGFLFCLKMTNIVYLVPLVLFYIWKIRKHITPALFGECLAAGIVPVTIYLVYNGITTGNPVYPYYNEIFGSPYFTGPNFKDTRWGPQSPSEILLWPWYMIRYPDYHFSEMYCGFNLDLAAGYLLVFGLLAVLAAEIRKNGLSYGRKYRIELYLLAIYGVSIAAWTVTTGHIRYFMAGLVLLGIMAACVFLRMAASKRALCLAAGLILLLPFVGRAVYGYHSVWKGNEWALRLDAKEEYRQNLPLVFRDRELFPPEVKEKLDMIFLTWGDYGGFARMAGEEVPVLNHFAMTTELADCPYDYTALAEDYMRQGKGVYDMFPQGNEPLDGYLTRVTEAGWYVEDLFYLDSILRGQQSYTMAGLGIEEGRQNVWYYAEYVWENPGMTFEKTEDYCSMEAIVGDGEYFISMQPYEVEVIASDGENQKTAAILQVGPTAYGRKTIDLDLTGLSGEITLTFKSLAQYRRAVILNPQWIVK